MDQAEMFDVNFKTIDRKMEKLPSKGDIANLSFLGTQLTAYQSVLRKA